MTNQTRARLSETEAAELRFSNAAQHREASARLSEAEAAESRSVNAMRHRLSRTSRNIGRLQETTGIARRIDQRPEDVHDLGSMNDICHGCEAQHFKDERRIGRPYVQRPLAAFPQRSPTRALKFVVSPKSEKSRPRNEHEKLGSNFMNLSFCGSQNATLKGAWAVHIPSRPRYAGDELLQGDVYN